MAGIAVSLPRRRAVLIGLLLAVELVLLAAAYQVFASLECQQTGAFGTCRFLRTLVARAVALLAALFVYARARPEALAALEGGGERRWLLLHAAGVGLLFLPLVLARGAGSAALFSQALLPWAVGAGAAACGALFWFAPPAAWGRWIRSERGLPLVVAGVAVVLPDLANLVLPLWHWPAFALATFGGVLFVLSLFGASPEVWPDQLIIGMRGFYIRVAEQCSGVEGFALVTGFVLLYAVLFRRELRLGRYALVVLPLGLAASWVLNVVRVSALIGIGANLSPDLAANGFHSYAGWMFFTLLALSLLWLVQAVPWLHKGPAAAPAKPLRQDWTAACILPFVIFMLASAVAPALVPVPELAYPVKVAAMLGALAFFRPAYERLGGEIDPLAAVIGAVVGGSWILSLPPADPHLAAALGGLGTAAFIAWAVLRVLGTGLLVPMIEELFFRGYVLARLDAAGTGTLPRLAALAVSAGLFALLHGRWLAAGLAGLVFGLVYLRRSRVADAIAAHATANLVIAAWAIASRNWSAF